MAIKLSKFRHLSNEDYNLGVEIECLVKEECVGIFENEIQRLNKSIIFGEDGSLRPKEFDAAYELRTPVLSVPKALNLVNDIFEIIKKYGYCNTSTGLHLNFSPVRDEDYYKINPFYLATKSLWKKIKQDFGREKNRFCHDFICPPCLKRNPKAFFRHIKHGMYSDYNWNAKNTKDYKHQNAITLWFYLIELQEFRRFKKNFVKYLRHYCVTNFDNLHAKRKNESRFEVRAMGGKDYHLKFDKVVKYTNQILALLKNSCKYSIN